MGDLAEKLVDTQTIGHGVLGQVDALEVHNQGAAPSDSEGVVERLGEIGKQLGHLCRRAQILLFAVAARPARIAEDPVLGNADPRLVRFELAGLDKTHIVARHHRAGTARRQCHRGVHVLFVVRAAGAL